MKPDTTDTAASTEWHDGHIPSFVEAALDTLYGSLYSTLPQLALGDLRGASTYVVRSAGRIQTLFLFSLDGTAARVINEGMTIAVSDADRFANQLFQRFPTIVRIDFHAVACASMPSTQPAFRFLLDEDIVIELPATEADYLARLSKSARKALRQSFARAEGLVHRVLPGIDTDAGLVQRIVGFNHARLAEKRRRSALDQAAVGQLLTLLQARGMVGVLTIAGQLCAGTLACRIGNDIYSLVNAHDPAFNTLGLGNLSRHLMIVAAIRAGARRFHLMGGNFNSKRASGAERKALHHLVMYRDRWKMFADLRHLGWLALREQRYRVGISVEEGSSMTGAPALSRAITALARLMRAARHRPWRLRHGRHTVPH